MYHTFGLPVSVSILSLGHSEYIMSENVLKNLGYQVIQRTLLSGNIILDRMKLRARQEVMNQTLVLGKSS